MTSLQDKFTQVEYELGQLLVNREQEIRGLSLAVLAKEHVLFLGPPGVAKTLMVSQFSQALNLSFFRRLVTQFSTPDEIIGPVDIAEYAENSTYRRIIKGKAADSEVVLLDEVFKGGPSILNSLLSIMEERVLDNDGTTVDVPLVTLIGTSNELPNDDDALHAFYDRFLLRYNIGYINDDLGFRSMLKLPRNGTVTTSIDSAELKQAQDEVLMLPVNNSAFEAVESLWEALREEDIWPSDRRSRKLLEVMAAEAWLQGQEEVDGVNITVANNIMWNNPTRDEMAKVKRCTLSSMNPNAARAQEILAGAKETMEELVLLDAGAALQFMRQLQAMQRDINEMPQD
ncbi:MAG: AAA family ATPase, partial [Dehalococcoidales bacterium]